MRCLILAFVALAATPSSSDSASDADGIETIRVLSFNVRYMNRRDGQNTWDYRKHLVAGTIRLHRPDVFGVQEALGPQIRYLQGVLPYYESFGSGRDGRAGGERSSIFYDRQKVEKLRGETFWLSPTPEKPSAAWGASLRRICTWGEFKSRATDKTFFVFNTHFDHKSRRSRLESAKLILTKIEELAGDHPVVLMGDFNCGEFSKPYQAIVRGDFSKKQDRDGENAGELALYDARLWTMFPFGSSGTFTGFGDAAVRGSKIDHIFVKNAVNVLQHAVLSDAWQGRLASDHRAVMAELELHRPFEPHTVNIGHLWRFRPDQKLVGHKRGYTDPAHDDSKWSFLEAGEPWENQGHADFDGVAYLRKRVTIPESWKREAVCLVSYGIGDAFTLFVNGIEVATIGGAGDSVWNRYVALHVPASVLKFGEDNSLALRVTDTGGTGGLIGFPLLLTVSDREPTHNGNQFEFADLISRKDFKIPEETRRLEWAVEIPAEPKAASWLRVGVGHGYDDSGDRGVKYQLLDAENRVVDHRFANSKAVVWFEHTVAPGTKWTIVITDHDTIFGGKFSGNGCNLRVVLKSDRGVAK